MAGPTRLAPLLVLETSSLLSAVANGITIIAFPWLVLELTGSAAAAGAIGAITALPLALSFLFAGVVVDIVGRRRVAVVADVLSMTSAALVPILALTTGLSFWSLAALAVLGAVFDPAGVSARETVLPEVATAVGMRRERVNGIHEAIWGAGFLLGPGLGGLSLGFFGAAPTYWFTAGMFLISAVVILFLRVPGAGRPAPEDRPTGVLSGAYEGIQFVWRDRTLRTVAIVSMMIVGIYLPVEGVILPVYFSELGKPEQLGFTIMAMAVGGVIGALLYSLRGHRWKPRVVFTSSYLLSGLALLGMALFPPLPFFVLCGFAAGLFYGPMGPVINLVMQDRTPFRLRGRVVSLMTSAAYIAGPIGYVLIGPGVEVIGLELAFVAVAVGVIVVGMITVFLRPLRALDTLAGEPHGTATTVTPPQEPGGVAQL